MTTENPTDPMASFEPDDLAGFDDAVDPVAAAPLVEPDQGWIADDEPAVVATLAGGDGGPLSAEEAAIHITSEDEAPGLNWEAGPGYLDDDPGDGSDAAGAGPAAAAEA